LLRVSITFFFYNYVLISSHFLFSGTYFKQGISRDKSSEVASEGCTNDSIPSKDPEGGENCEGDADPESLSDIDDVEVDWYLHNEEETQYKKIIWEEMNKEYLEEQAAKEALAAELVARGVDVEEGKKKKRRRNEDTKSSKPAETPAAATYNMLKRKGLGSKVSEGAVDQLYKVCLFIYVFIIRYYSHVELIDYVLL